MFVYFNTTKSNQPHLLLRPVVTPTLINKNFIIEKIYFLLFLNTSFPTDCKYSPVSFNNSVAKPPAPTLVLITKILLSY